VTDRDVLDVFSPGLFLQPVEIHDLMIKGLRLKLFVASLANHFSSSFNVDNADLNFLFILGGRACLLPGRNP